MQKYESVRSQAVEQARDRAYAGGIWRHSGDSRYFIFCVGQSKADITRFMCFALKRNIGFKPLSGKYEGKPEQSFIANMRDFAIIKPFLNEQESILIIDRYDARDMPRASLRHLKSGITIEMGTFTPVGKKRAMREPSWTYDDVTERYFICVK